MRVGAVPRKYADSVVKGEGIHLVGLGEVFLCRKILEVGQHMKATDTIAVKGDYVICVPPERTQTNKLSHL
jgi:hypothetical protein